jgi:hypothetical protein
MLGTKKWSVTSINGNAFYDWKEIHCAMFRDMRIDLTVMALSKERKERIRKTPADTPVGKVYSRNYQLFFQIESTIVQRTTEWKEKIRALVQLHQLIFPTWSDLVEHEDEDLILGVDDLEEAFQFLAIVKDQLEEW